MTPDVNVKVDTGAYRAVIRREPGGGAVVVADDWLAAAAGLGFQMATDRTGQMDMLRRTARGTTAELLGREALDFDLRQRRLGLGTVARRCLELLPPEQVRTLDAFAQGVNAAWRGRGSVMRWAAVDSVHVAQVLFQQISPDGAELRMTEVLRRTLPAVVADFLLDDADEYATGPGGEPVAPSGRPVPWEELRALFAELPPADPGPRVVTDSPGAGSNAWAFTTPRGAVLANDMHLPLGDPTVMYPVRMTVGCAHVRGVSVPGLPVPLAGSNGNVAWGLTRLPADTADLRVLSPDERGNAAPRREVIEIRGEPSVAVEFQDTPWGPVVDPVAGEQVAFAGTLIDPRALDFGLLRLIDAPDLAHAVEIVNDCGLPPVNVLIADRAGRIGWTVGGRLPLRGGPGPRGLSRPTGPAPGAWVPPSDLPRLLDPPSGLVVNCNNGGREVRRTGIAWNLPGAVRARRVSALVAGGPPDAAGARAAQMDIDAVHYRFYRDLALRHLPREPRTPALREVRADITGWGGTAGADERGLALLSVFRELVREELIAAATRPARRLDPAFTYCYAGAEGVLRRLIAAVHGGLTPAPWRSGREFLVGQLLIARSSLLRRAGGDRLPRWGEVNRLRLTPLAAYPPDPIDPELSGCAESIRVAQPDFGAAMRLVVDLRDPDSSSLSIPGTEAEGTAMAEAIRSWSEGEWWSLYPPATEASPGEGAPAAPSTAAEPRRCEALR
jgi:penicillin amidase